MQRIPVFYREEMVADIASFSPSAAKPRALIARWLAEERQIDVFSPAPVARTDLYRAHDTAFVDSVLDLREDNGFGNRDARAAASFAYTSGAMLAAARAAIANRRVAVAPVSGFHHAGYDFAGGFCTFNGLMVTALALHEEGHKKIGILDLDEHYGNGTDHIIDRLRIRWIEHFTAGASYSHPRQAEDFLGKLPGIVAAFADCAVLLYQAGADPHIDDPLGGWLTSAQLRRRDRIVFETARALNLPVAWNLAGGYQEPLSKVLDIHCNTLEECAQVYL